MILCLCFSYILIHLFRVNYLLVQAVFLHLVLMTDRNLIIGLLRILPRKLGNVVIRVGRGTGIFDMKKLGMTTVLLSCFFLRCLCPVTLIKTSNYYSFIFECLTKTLTMKKGLRIVLRIRSGRLHKTP